MRNKARWSIIIFISFYLLSVVPVLAGTYVLNASLKNWDGTQADDLKFPGAVSVTKDNPWVWSPQYIRVIYSSSETSWAIRIVTDNENNIGQVYPKPLNPGPPPKDKYEWEYHPDWNGKYKYQNGEWLTDNDSVSFGGLVDPVTKGNPNFRPLLAWQVFAQPVAEPGPIYKHPFFGWWNVGTNPKEYNGDWIYPYEWAYVVDKSNKWNGESVIGDVFYPPPPLYNLKYEIVANGTGQLGWLAQYPPSQMSNPDPRYGDGWDSNDDGVINELDDNDVNDDGHVECDMAIYLAACFGVPSDEVEGEFVGLMPCGDYGTYIYLELMHE